VAPSIKGENDAAGRRVRRETDRLSSDKVVVGRGWHSREIKLKNLNVKKVTQHWG
jgi:hypothetical protein